jgi:hypothetical protein
MSNEDLSDQALDLLNQINELMDLTMEKSKKMGVHPMSMLNPDGTSVMAVILHAKAMTLNALTLLKE